MRVQLVELTDANLWLIAFQSECLHGSQAGSVSLVPVIAVLESHKLVVTLRDLEHLFETLTCIVAKHALHDGNELFCKNVNLRDRKLELVLLNLRDLGPEPWV